MKTKLLAASAIAASLILVAGCGNSDTSDTKKEETTAKTETTAKHEDHLDYHDQKSWQFEAGDTQSPINIETAKTEPMKDTGTIELNYNQKVTDEVDNGHSIQVDDGGQATINGRKFELNQFHFHAESEHTVDGKHYPIEAHFVNENQDSRLAVIGVFFTEGKANPAFQSILNNVKKGEKTAVSEPIDVAALLPTNKSYYHYLGSLTTPPLSENVEWYVMSTPVEVSKEQIEEFNKYYDGNNRKVQPLHDRPVLKHTDN
ncbi:carbonic anhydrase [Listeria cornellensis]|uniref:Carbonic anhydrase n=1 Tax=Listeria cornellensis FSL F6-0969 TaxID=1265820 RepID=W7BS03_9LIST|nr:carbonic anhydrase family protein [Listeria cornellensis]EUJ29534.1 eukaryotic-type carbonic anhydrase family protein [Listeria cornellensis FSL F6-0969]